MQKVNIKILNSLEAVSDISIALSELGFDVDVMAVDEIAEIKATRPHEYELPGSKPIIH